MKRQPLAASKTWQLDAAPQCAMAGEIFWFKITIDKEKHDLKESQPDEHEEFPLNYGGEPI